MAQRKVEKEFTGSWGVFFLWLLLFFPVAIIYFFMNYRDKDRRLFI
jgi:hypothetical protein